LIAQTKSLLEKEQTPPRIPLVGAMASDLLAALCEEPSRRILASTLSGGKSVLDMSAEQAIPLSTCYRRLRELTEQRLLVLEKIVVTAEGKKFRIYRSIFKNVEIAWDIQGLSISAELNDLIPHKFPSGFFLRQT
jgi:hypothetical protein